MKLVAARPVPGASFSVEQTQEFHRRVNLLIEAVQAGIWEAGTHELLGYSTDFGLGQKRGAQTLALKTSRKSAYLRFHWDTILGDGSADRRLMEEATRSAIVELG
jgi:hypothetical protein